MAVVAVGGFMALSSGTGAFANTTFKDEYKYWQSESNPLKVSGYGSTVYGYGQWRVTDNSSGTRSFLDARLWYSNADNHKKYAELETQANVTPAGAISAQFFPHAIKATPSSNYTSKTWNYVNTSVHSWGTKARAAVVVCLDIPNRFDPCSGESITGSTNY
ncbi:hypothetical protein [Salinispora mooreana]|uniref:hypothetical protein n=1 Tax=Salinispora mooreana TaxID=999545 RepID=UPI001CC7662A|nr:hypothetical protein [Salinispora mooreana]